MKKFFYTLAGVIFSFCIIRAAEYHQVPYDEKIKEGKLTFLLTFDKHNVNADLAGGKAENLLNPDISLLLRGQYGFDGQQAYKPENDEELLFAVADNFDPAKGTMSMWVRTDSFEPGDAALKKNIGVFQVDLREKGNRLRFMAYFYGGTLYFTCIGDPLEQPGGWGQTKSVNIPADMTNFTRDQWFQITWTWDSEYYHFYVNGNLAGKGEIPALVRQMMPFNPEKNSSMRFSCGVWDEKRHTALAVDDIKIYTEPFNELLIRKQYVGLAKDAPDGPLRQIKVEHSGKDRGRGRIPLLHLQIDTQALENPADSLSYKLTSANGTEQEGVLNIVNFRAALDCEIPAPEATYSLEVQASGIREVYTFTTPDFSFAANSPPEKTVIPPWTGIEIDNNRTVKVWNRTYRFADGPFPVQALCGDIELLEQSPTLLIDGLPVQWRAGTVEHSPSVVTLTGQGSGTGFTIEYKTKIEFDGMIQVNFFLYGEPQISTMKLQWKAAPAIREFLLTPRLQLAENCEFDFPTGSAFRNHYLVWQASEKAGFCWMPIHDANWVNDTPGKAIKVNRPEGLCEVNLISKKVKIPEGTEYHSLFIATPTRPAPPQVRAQYDNRLYMNGYGEKHAISLEVDEVMMKLYAARLRPRTIIPYCMGHGQNASNPTASYLKKSWDIPGSYIYLMPDPTPNYEKQKYDFLTSPSVNICPDNTLYTDYITGNIEKLLSHEYGNRIDKLYYDLGDVSLCRNPEHGCAFTDRFGRQIGSLNVLGMRDLVYHTLRVAHPHDTELIMHAQDCFTPFANGMADYWLPGEQHASLLARSQFAYTDDIPEEYYRSEYNRDVLGCGVLFLPAIPPEFRSTVAATEAMLAMLLLHDIDWMNTNSLASGIASQQVWSIFQHYRLHDPGVKFHSYRSQQEVKSSNPAVRISWYECPAERYLLVLANKHDKPATTAVDFNFPEIQVDRVHDEYRNISYPVKNGSFEITVSPRSFALVSVGANPWFPCHDGFETAWNRYMDDNPAWGEGQRHSQPFYDKGVFRTAAPSLVVPPRPPVEISCTVPDLRLPAEVRLANVRIFPVEAGAGYEMEIWGKTADLPSEGAVNIHMVPLDGDLKRLNGMVSTKLMHPNGDWEKVRMEIQAPAKARWLRVELENVNSGSADVWFDDFSIIKK